MRGAEARIAVPCGLRDHGRIADVLMPALRFECVGSRSGRANLFCRVNLDRAVVSYRLARGRRGARNCAFLNQEDRVGQSPRAAHGVSRM